MNRPQLIRLGLVEVTPRRRCLSALAKWLAACPTGGSALMVLPTRFCPMIWSTSIRTRLGVVVTRSQQHYRTVLPLSLPLPPRREPRGSGGKSITIRHKALAKISVGGSWPYMAALRTQTRVLASGSPTIRRAVQGRRGRGGWRCGRNEGVPLFSTTTPAYAPLAPLGVAHVGP